MLANTLTITIDGTAHVMVRVNQDNFSSLYRKVDAAFLMEMKIRHSVEATSPSQPIPVDRHNVFFERTVYATPTEVEKYYSVSHTMRVRRTSDPSHLEKVDLGFTTLEGAIRANLVAGEP